MRRTTLPNDPSLVHKVESRVKKGSDYIWHCSCGEKLTGTGVLMVEQKWAKHYNEARETDVLAAQEIAEEEDQMEFPTVRANRGHIRLD